MTKIIMLGVGNGGPLELYNTCFVIQNEKGNFLVDTGGSIQIIKKLNEVNIDYKEIKNIFISHSHTDHILGLFWLFKKISRDVMHGNITEKINIYCNDVVYEAIKGVSKYVLPDKLMTAIYDIVDFKILEDGDKYNINGIDYTFFDIRAKGTKQYGFECILNNKKLAFLGDETLNPLLYDRFKNYDYVMHEAFCLDSEESIFNAYEKNHST
ncbi:MAG TPA: MBL fold metallo-hydrolase, partial [Firmicutes bacterium]|nr:MBL fold metallo-hydrolase [Bacillota bacterium]